MTKIITVIIPTYNRKLNFNLISKFYKFKKKIELIIVDDGSNQLIESFNSKKIKKYLEFKYLHYHKNRGQSFACNSGIKITNTKYVWFFDDDDNISIKTLDKILFSLKKNFDGLLLPMKQVYKNKLINLVYPSIRSHTFDDLRDNGQLVSTSCAIFKTKIIKKIKGWDIKLFGGTDTDLFLRFSKYGNFSFIDTNPVIINISKPNRLTNKVFRQQLAKIYFLKKHWKILTIKRILYYLITGLFFYPLFYGIRNKMKYLSKKRSIFHIM